MDNKILKVFKDNLLNKNEINYLNKTVRVQLES